jgi:hypothetical protein
MKAGNHIETLHLLRCADSWEKAAELMKKESLVTRVFVKSDVYSGEYS